MLKMRHFLFVILILMTATLSFGVEPQEIYAWKYVDFVWEYPEAKNEAIERGDYDPVACVLYDVDKAPDGRTFVTSVREKGVPASLMTVTNEIGPGGPLLRPYPNWSWYKNTFDCNNIISVYRVCIKCNHIFVLDCGKIGEKAVCPPKLLIFDLKDDMLVKRVTIPPEIANNKNGTGLLVTPLAYVRNCRRIKDVTVFIADIEGFGLVIYNENSGFCRIESDFMKPTDPNFTIAGQSFTLEDGILGLTIIDKDLYYSPLAGNTIYKMNMCSKYECSELNKSEANKLTQLAGTISGQTGPIASKYCALFFSNIPETSILCQDATKEFNSTNTEVLAQNPEKIQFPSGMKVIKSYRDEEQLELLMYLTNRFQRVMTETLNLNETNFRVFAMNMLQIRKETNCFDSCNNDNKHHGHHKPWHRGPSIPWNHRPWNRKPWYYFDKHDDYDKHDDHDKHDDCDKHDEPDKHDKHNGHDGNDKYNKHDEHDENDTQEKKYF